MSPQSALPQHDTALTNHSFTDKPKYVCPRDKVRTCSLACYKRHQQRASCNGQRDPTAYVKKNDLATPAGIDHDFNFLSGIERTFDKAAKHLQDKGMEASSGMKKRWQSDGPLQRYIRENNIVVDKAPVGMSRQKTNQTRYIQKSKRIVWTVEWVDVKGVKRLSEVHEAATLGDAYATMLAEREKESKKRKRSQESQAERDVRRAMDVEEGQDQPATEAESSHAAATQEEKVALEGTVARGEARLEEDTTTPSLPTSAQDSEISDANTASSLPAIEPTASTQANPNPDPEPPTSASKQDTSRTQILTRIQTEQSRQALLHASTPTNLQTPAASPPPQAPQPHFYLQTPHTSSLSVVLTPLFPTATLTQNLSHHTVLEFPTIHILPCAVDALPSGFVSATAYAREKVDEEREIEEMFAAVATPSGGRTRTIGFRGEEGGERVDGEKEREKEGGKWDERRILEMLKRDVHD